MLLADVIMRRSNGGNDFESLHIIIINDMSSFLMPLITYPPIVFLSSFGSTYYWLVTGYNQTIATTGFSE